MPPRSLVRWAKIGKDRAAFQLTDTRGEQLYELHGRHRPRRASAADITVWPSCSRLPRSSQRSWPSPSPDPQPRRSPGPVFVDGQAQPVFSTVPATWIRQELWVETEVDSDFDGKLDRIHTDVSRVQETDTDGLKVPVIMEASPYYAGTRTSSTGPSTTRSASRRPRGRSGRRRCSTRARRSRTRSRRPGCRAATRSCTSRASAAGTPKAARPPAAERDARPEGRDRLAERPGRGFTTVDGTPRSPPTGRPARPG